MISQSDLILVGLAFLIGYLNDTLGPQPYHYGDKIVIVDKKYQCPTYCDVHHNHSVYFKSDSNRMVIDEKKLGKRYKIKKNKKKK
tara:strand:- start:234 stop:488 length:255 start_codon:yes stop_codon:yes gene_type:complete